jgi:hypothetical protein
VNPSPLVGKGKVENPARGGGEGKLIRMYPKSKDYSFLTTIIEGEPEVKNTFGCCQKQL